MRHDGAKPIERLAEKLRRVEEEPSITPDQRWILASKQIPIESNSDCFVDNAKEEYSSHGCFD